MGFEPLPFDPIGPCLCHRNCPDFKKVSARYWSNTFGVDVEPRLEEGVLMELDPGSSSQSECIWTPTPPFIFPKSFILVMRHFPQPAPFKINWECIFSIFAVPGDYLALRTDRVDPCSFSDQDLFQISGPQDWPQTELIRVDWWKNANDVPH